MDATAISGAATVGIYGAQGFGVTNIGGIVGSFNAMLPTGTNDIAAVVYDTSFNVIAVKIVRSQTVPLSGLSIVFAPTDASSQEFATITGSPAGFTASPSVIAQFITGNGTSFVVSSTNLPNTAYALVAVADTQASDYYYLSANASDQATHQAIFSSEISATPGAATLALPVPLTVPSPSPSAFPSFDIVYSGFSGDASISDFAGIAWSDGSNTQSVFVLATSTYQNGSTTLAIPDLSAVPGFLPSAVTGTTVSWGAGQRGGSYQTLMSAPSSGSQDSASVSGSFTEP